MTLREGRVNVLGKVVIGYAQLAMSRGRQADMLKLIVIKSDISDDAVLALAADIEHAQYATWQTFGAMLRSALPRVLEGWTADDISELSLGDLIALPTVLARAVEMRQLPIRVPNA